MIIRRIPNPFNFTLYFLIALFIFEYFVPFENINGSSYSSKLLLLIIFLFLAATGNRFIPKSLSINNVKLPSDKTFNLIRFFTFLGPIFLFIDRFYTRQIDFNLGITNMRHAMERESTGGISSIFSVSGYLSCALAFLLLNRLVIFTKHNKKKTNYFDGMLIFYSIIGVSILTGGRSTVFIFLGFLYTAMFCKLNLLKNKINIKFKNLIFIIVVISSVLYYVNYVFKDRANLSNVEAKYYYSSIISHLNGKEKESVNLHEKSDFYIYSQLTLAYFIHQFWIFENSLSLSENLKKGDSVFVTWKTILSKTNLIDKPAKWYYSGYYIPLVGTFIYSYGYFLGITLFLFLIWGIFFLSGFLLKKYASFVSFFLFNFSGFVLLFSIMLPSTDILMVPIILISLVFVFPLLKFISKFRIKLK